MILSVSNLQSIFSGLFDSLAMLGLVALCDTDFQLTIQPQEILQLETVDALYEKITELKGSK